MVEQWFLSRDGCGLSGGIGLISGCDPSDDVVRAWCALSDNDLISS